MTNETLHFIFNNTNSNIKILLCQFLCRMSLATSSSSNLISKSDVSFCGNREIGDVKKIYLYYIMM